jgi:hypothetical protein
LRAARCIVGVIDQPRERRADAEHPKVVAAHQFSRQSLGLIFPGFGATQN